MLTRTRGRAGRGGGRGGQLQTKGRKRNNNRPEARTTTRMKGQSPDPKGRNRAEKGREGGGRKGAAGGKATRNCIQTFIKKPSISNLYILWALADKKTDRGRGAAGEGGGRGNHKLNAEKGRKPTGGENHDTHERAKPGPEGGTRTFIKKPTIGNLYI